ncbi:DUF167 domain-containing protein [Patescibacteria group bacterium]|nr:DUF167 domain-containing protein [Patescibacteria group bacterium]MBU2158881.1 DUF167 domain-containing protein [Patescibacteria group bacterium]MBU2220777.1 DUF167 domain-containing protein [Patescibacteria group bacterium]
MYIHARVTAGARKETFEQTSSDHFIISVREKAENNLANKRVREVISEYFKIPSSQVRIVNGHHSPSKLLSVTL